MVDAINLCDSRREVGEMRVISVADRNRTAPPDSEAVRFLQLG